MASTVVTIDEIDYPSLKVDRGPTNSNNSCFLDSVFVAMFAIPNIFTSTFILSRKLKQRASIVSGTNTRDELNTRKEIQREITRLTRLLRSTTSKTRDKFTLDVLRVLLARCTQLPISEILKSKQQGDASEVVLALSNIFELDDVNECVVDVYATNDVLDDEIKTMTLTSTRTERYGIVHRMLPNNAFSLFTVSDSGPLDEPLRVPSSNTSEPEREFYRVITKSRVLPKHYMVVHVDRTALPGELVDRRPVKMPKSINKLELVFVVMHTGKAKTSGHYTCFFRSELGHWQYYSGTGTIENVDNIDDEDNAIDIKGVLFGYCV